VTGVEEARRVLADGGLVVYPTETAYGIGCDALNPDAVERVYEAKQRPRKKGLTVICSSLKQVENHASLTGLERRLVEKLMPGPLTLVVEPKEHVPGNLNEGFAFRVSSSELCRDLASDFPIVATSANISGRETSYSVDEISGELLDEVDAVLDRGGLEPSPTSTVVEITDGDIQVHRPGPIPRQDMEEVLQ
jgi:L-threonylcarbamoyladenylate synthase